MARQNKEKILEALEEASIEPTRRGETLSIQEFGKLADCLYPNFCKVRQFLNNYVTIKKYINFFIKKLTIIYHGDKILYFVDIFGRFMLY